MLVMLYDVPICMNKTDRHVNFFHLYERKCSLLLYTGWIAGIFFFEAPQCEGVLVLRQVMTSSGDADTMEVYDTNSLQSSRIAPVSVLTVTGRASFDWCSLQNSII